MKTFWGALSLLICLPLAQARVVSFVGEGQAADGSWCRLEMDLHIADNKLDGSKSKIFYLKMDSRKSVMFMSLDRPEDWIQGTLNPLEVKGGAGELKFTPGDGFNLGFGSFSNLKGGIHIRENGSGGASAKIKWVEGFRTRLDETCTVATYTLTDME